MFNRGCPDERGGVGVGRGETADDTAFDPANALLPVRALASPATPRKQIAETAQATASGTRRVFISILLNGTGETGFFQKALLGGQQLARRSSGAMLFLNWTLFAQPQPIWARSAQDPAKRMRGPLDFSFVPGSKAE